MNFEENLVEVFERMKCFSVNDQVVLIPIYNENKELIGNLKPITRDDLKSSPEIPKLLTQWRIENPTLSTGKFTPTAERTALWLEKQIIGRKDRLLFMIQDLNNHFLGHIGLSSFRFEDETGEIDCVCRGIHNVIPGLMNFSTKSIIEWGFEALKMNAIELSVYDDNFRAVQFYERFGFKVISKKPLYKAIVDGEEKLEVAPPGFTGPIVKYYLVMQYKGNN